MTDSYLIGEYLIEQLNRHGVNHVFGIPGDYVLGFFDLLTKSDKVEVINTSDEQEQALPLMPTPASTGLVLSVSPTASVG